MKEGVEMVEVFERSVRPQAISSSNGNQLKWENHNVWYKADYTGYEGLAEYVVSHMLCKSSLNKKEIGDWSGPFTDDLLRGLFCGCRKSC